MWPGRLDRVFERVDDLLPGLQTRRGLAGSRPSVLPVTVMQLPSSSPFSSRYFITAGVPPTSCRSSITYLPLGLKSARNGIRSLTLWKSSIVSGTSHGAGHGDQVQHGIGRAAQRHHDDHRVLERRARHDVARLEVAFEQLANRRARRRSTRRAWRDPRPGSTSCTAATCPSLRWPRPSCWPCTCRRTRPAPGQRVADDRLPLFVRDLAGDVLAVALKRRDDVELRRRRRRARPGSCRRRPSATADCSRPIAIRQPGMFLSQPGIEMFASYHWAHMTVSIESAIRSRDCSE